VSRDHHHSYSANVTNCLPFVRYKYSYVKIDFLIEFSPHARLGIIVPNLELEKLRPKGKITDPSYIVNKGKGLGVFCSILV
jgi:hypothetical protein